MLLDYLVERQLQIHVYYYYGNELHDWLLLEITWHGTVKIRTKYCSQASCVFASLSQMDVGMYREDSKKDTLQLVLTFIWRWIG